MVATITRRVMLRPEIDEPCPEWALPLLPLSDEAETHGVGIANERVPQETAVVLDDLFPAPPKPVRERERQLTERRYKPYVKAWAAAVYFALLPFALAKQVSLFCGSGGETTADVAVLCFRRLSDLAPKLGISYDRLQKWMTVLLVLGFIKRFRDGRRVLYILPLTAYIPSPSPEAVLKKLNELIESQFVEATLPDGRTLWLDRCPEWTAQLLEIRSRFVQRYHPAVAAEELLAPPASTKDLLPPPLCAEERQQDQVFQAMLHEVSEAIPAATRAEMMRRLFPALARAYAEIIESTSDRKPLSDPQVRTTARSKEALRESSSSPNLDLPGSGRGKTGGANAIESRFGTPNPDLTGAASDGQSRFDAARPAQGASPNSLRGCAGVSVQPVANLDSMAGESLTLCCNTSNNNSLKEDQNVNVRDGESRLRKESRKKAELLAELLCVPGNVNRYTKLFNQVSRGELGEDLIKACFVYTLYREREGAIIDRQEDRLGKYFHGVFTRWSAYGTYGAACGAYNSKKWHGRTPPGIRPRDAEIIDPFMSFGYEQIADMIRRGVRAAEVGWLEASPERVLPVYPMDELEAEALAQAIRTQALWYLQDPHCCQVTSGDTVFFVVEAKLDGSPCTFESWDDWLDYHFQMLTPPGPDPWPAIDADWPDEAQRERALLCARAGYALLAQLNRRSPGATGDLDPRLSLTSSLSFEALARLGEPVLFLREKEVQMEKPCQGLVAGEGLNVKLEEGVVLTYEQFQALLANGGYHGECVELEDGGFLPRTCYEELLATGEYRKLEDGTPDQSLYYEALKQHVLLECLDREEAVKRRAEASQEGLRVEQTDRTEASFAPADLALRPGNGLPGWWEELGLDEGDGASLDAEAARQCLLLLQRALAPQLYRLQMREDRSEDALGFVLELISLCSGWLLVFRRAAQVERVLEQLAVQQGTGEVEGARRLLSTE